MAFEQPDIIAQPGLTGSPQELAVRSAVLDEIWLADNNEPVADLAQTAPEGTVNSLSRADSRLIETTALWRTEIQGKDQEEIREVFQRLKGDFLSAIDLADEDFQSAGDNMEAVIPGFDKSAPGPAELIDSLQTLSGTLDELDPQSRARAAQAITSDRSSSLDEFPRVKTAFENLDASLSSLPAGHPDRATVARAWLPYRESFGDTIGPRLVVAGLLNMYGNDADRQLARELQATVVERKALMGGFYNNNGLK